jgi:hypothetical protein
MDNLPDLAIEEGIQFFPQTNESLAQLLADHLRIKAKAFIRRSDYKNTWGSFEERRMMWAVGSIGCLTTQAWRRCIMPSLSTGRFSRPVASIRFEGNTCHRG